MAILPYISKIMTIVLIFILLYIIYKVAYEILKSKHKKKQSIFKYIVNQAERKSAEIKLNARKNKRNMENNKD